jgi:hypothetical protein
VHSYAGELTASGFAFLLPISQDLARRVADQLEILILEGLPTEVSGKPQILLDPGDQAAVATELGGLTGDRLGDRQAVLPNLVQRADGKSRRAERLFDLAYIMKRHDHSPTKAQRPAVATPVMCGTQLNAARWRSGKSADSSRDAGSMSEIYRAGSGDAMPGGSGRKSSAARARTIV